MEIKTTQEIGEINDIAFKKLDSISVKKKWVDIEDLKKRLFDSDIPIKHSQKLIEELEVKADSSQT